MTTIAKNPRKFSKSRPTYKQAIEPHRIRDLESFLDGLERAWDAAKREGVRMDVGKCIEALRHR